MIIKPMEDTENHKNDGFTLLEIIVVMLIVGIISVSVASRYSESGHNELTGQIEVIKSHLRYAQLKSMNSTPPPFWYIHFETTPAQYTLYSGGTKKYFPGEAYDYVPLKAGMSISLETYVLFDDLGRPYPDMGTPGTQLTTVKTIVTSSAGNIEIKPETGFIP